MSEIICRNCQTANPADNKFCTKCGNRLKPDTHLVCPSCYHRNGLNRLHCENCGTRLISNAPLNIEGPAGKRQTVSAPDDKNQPENDELDWLLSGQDVDIEDEKQVTDWLTKLKDSKPLAPLDAEPVNPFAQEGRVEPLEPDESVSLPDWLNDTAVSPDTPETTAPPDEALPSWLVGHTPAGNDDLDLDRESILGREDDVDWLGMLGAEPAIPEPEPDAPSSASFGNIEPDADDEDWLTDDASLDVSFDLEEEEEEEEETESTSTGFTKWLTPETVDEFEASQSEDDDLDDLFSPQTDTEEGLPSWLDASSGSDDDESEADDFLSALGLDESDEDEDDVSHTGFTSWLTDTGQAEREETPSASLSEPESLHDEDEDEDEIPAWLNPSPEESRATSSLSGDPSLTNWLEADESQTETAEDLPDWLREPTLGTSEPDTAVGTGFTAWLQEDKSPPEDPTPTETEPPETLPDWLAEDDADTDDNDLVSTGFTGFLGGNTEADSAAEPAETADETLPDWLKEETTETSSDEMVSTGFTSWLASDSDGGSDSGDPDQSGQSETLLDEGDDSDLPDWLRADESNAAQSTLSLSAETSDEEGTGFTDWLLESEGEGLDEDTSFFFDDEDPEPAMDLTPLSVEEAEQYLADTPEVSEDFIEESVGEDFPDWLVDVETITPDTASLKLPDWMQEPVSGTDELDLGLTTPAQSQDNLDFDFGLETSESAGSGLAWLDDDEDKDKAESAEPTSTEAEADLGDDWLADIGQAERSDLPQTDWLGRVSAEADQASNRMSWLGLNDDGATLDEDEDEVEDDPSYTKPDTDDLTKREMPSWLSASPEDELGIELDSGDDVDNGVLFDALDAGDNNWLSDMPSESPTSEAVSGLDWLSDMPSESADDRAGDDWLNDLGDFGGSAATSQLSWFEEDVEEADVVDRKKETAVDETGTTAVSPETSHLTEEPEPAGLADIDPLLSFESALDAFEDDSAEGDGLDWLTVLEENEEERAQAPASESTLDELGELDEPAESTADTDWDASEFETEDEELDASLTDELWLAAGTAASSDEEQLEIFSMLEDSGHTAVDDTAEFAGDDWLLPSSETAAADTAWSDDWQEEFGDGTSEYEEIPEWIDDLNGEEEEEEMQVGGPLDGLKGIIAVAPIVSQPITRINPLQTSALTITPEQTEQANLWQQVAQTELHPARGTAQSIAGDTAAHTPALPRVWRIALALLLVGAVLAGLLLPNVLGVAPAVPSPQVAAVQETLANNAGTTVLVAFEYPPAMAGELDETAILLLRELAVHGNTAVIMSQHPAGMANAERVLTAVPELEAANVLRLGYVPGDAVGLRELSGCLSLARCQTIFGRDLSATPLADTAVLIVLTSEQDNLINWIEQIGQPNDQPLIVAVTESLSPLARPYAQTGQISGLLQGLPDTASYASAYQPTTQSGTNLLTARALAQVAVIVVLILGLVWGFLPRRTPSSSSGAKTTSAEEEIEIL